MLFYIYLPNAGQHNKILKIVRQEKKALAAPQGSHLPIGTPGGGGFAMAGHSIFGLTETEY
jgi:hypothetical protein